MKLKRADRVLMYKDNLKLVEYDILTKFNPVYINKTIKVLNEQIEEMYHLSTSHTEPCDNGLYSVSVKVEDLVIWILEQKQALARYKRKSNRYIHILKKVASGYSISEQRAIKRYLSTNGVIYSGFELATLIKDIEKELN